MANTPERKPTTQRRTTPKKTIPPDRGRGTPNEEEIRRRAYELYERRGGEPGHEEEDWVRAESELRGET